MRSGFSLLEAVVATAILGLAAVASLSALGAQVRSAERARATVLLEALAQDRLTRVRLASPDQLDRLPDSLARGELYQPPDANPDARYVVVSGEKRGNRSRHDLLLAFGNHLRDADQRRRQIECDEGTTLRRVFISG